MITVRFFASYADQLGVKHAELLLGDSASVADVLASVSMLPGADAIPPGPLVAVNHVYASPKTALKAGDEVALIPPVAGG